MSILVNRDSKIIVQGITGREGLNHTQAMLAFGTKVVGGVTPGKGGQEVEGLPVFNSVQQAVDALHPDVSIIFVPPAGAADSVLEAAHAGVELIVLITEGVPTVDMMKAVQEVKALDAESRAARPSSCRRWARPDRTSVV